MSVLVSDEALSRFYTSSFQWHWHAEIELTLITEGTMVYQINDRIFHPRAGQALFGNSNTMHTGHMADGHDCKYISITFHPGCCTATREAGLPAGIRTL
ncbi:MAG: AraC family ligand binding domain-containing protein [Enterocloster clostridioformis]